MMFFAASTSSIVKADSPTTIIIMDGSGSMWGKIGGRPKLDIARETVTKVLATLPPDRKLGLMAYGHRNRGSCDDIELIVPPQVNAAGLIADQVNKMRFLGKTPLTQSVRLAAEALRYREEAATVVLVTDGLETCEADPCALARELEQTGIRFTAHVIGFGLTEGEGKQVACLASETGGRYMPANTADTLADALKDTVSAAPPPTPAATATYFPGAPLMANIAIQPTGRTTGAAETEPAAFTFPATGTAAQCAAQCQKDKVCAAWRYEPPGSLFVETPRCFTYPASSELDYEEFPDGDGWASGIKEGFLMLVRPYRTSGG